MVINLLQIAYTKRQTSYHWSNIYSVLLEHFIWSPLRTTTDQSIRPQYLVLLDLTRTTNNLEPQLADYNTILIAFESFVRNHNLSSALRASILSSFEHIFDLRNTHVQTRSKS